MKRRLCLLAVLLFSATMLSGSVFAQPRPEDPGIVRLRYATIVVPNYDEALRWYTDVLGFQKVEEGSFKVEGGSFKVGEGSSVGGQRWLVVAPRGQKDFGIVLELAQPLSPDDAIRDYKNRIGKETRWVFEVKDCHRFYELLSKRGVKFPETPVDQPWGVTEAQFEDLYGNVFVVKSPRPTTSGVKH
ncbi:MAG: VOC family protein [Acidobacteriia bacterium]|nr:VOC family protein [Terriglobia bacterium]